jgi:hypothetical protein
MNENSHWALNKLLKHLLLPAGYIRIGQTGFAAQNVLQVAYDRLGFFIHFIKLKNPENCFIDYQKNPYHF